MSELLSYCGIVCSTCPIYLATRVENRTEQTRKRAEIAQLCKEHYGLKYELSDITDCDGCRAESGRLFSGCLKCTIRECAKQKAIENCAYCTEYACQQLETFFIKDTSARIRLDEVRKHLK